MTKRHIHFVCRGNIYRSRLALLYAQTLKLKNVEFSCSGIEASKHYPHRHTISPLVVHIAQHHKLDLRLSPVRIQTTHESLSRPDLIIFMQTDILRDAKKRFEFNHHKAKSWHIDDWYEFGHKHRLNLADHRAQDDIAERTYRTITQRVDELVREVTQLGWVDIVDRDDRELGYQLPISWASADPDLWHRSCHAIITTPAGFVVEKRSPQIILSPGRLDISVGGAVDGGETPERAMRREIAEELGIEVKTDAMRLLERRRWNHSHPQFRRYSKTHLWSYHIHLDSTPNFVIQPAELAEVRVLSPAQVRYLLLKHGLPGFGKLNYPYAYYRKMIKLSQQSFS